MKRLAWMVPALLLAACNTMGNPNVPVYSISLTSLGYEVNEQGKITIPEVRANLVSTAGAPDVLKVEYTAVLLDGKGERAAEGNSIITPLNGLLFAGAKGGYFCFGGQPTPTTPATPENGCTMGSPDARPVTTGQWAANTVNRALVPGEWAIAHLRAGTTNATAPWSVDFTFTATQSTGRTVTWKQNYAFLAPARAGN
ncbi:hypothetical protein [Deinococcus murrayi]|uniref:hypothetical protein n=1 Tax=Deinococcus murrayi TaxID=68910 RepID=UPI000B1DFDD7|nr:hypothetical protein [Deinococcus murrayi]